MNAMQYVHIIVKQKFSKIKVHSVNLKSHMVTSLLQGL